MVKNDQFSWAEIAGCAFDNIVISPGPGQPGRRRDFGICREAILQAAVPVLGVCLGHQGLALAYGGEIGYAPEPMHGRVSRIRHDGSGLFAGVPQDFRAVRYHSLMVMPAIPECLQRTAWTADGTVMGLSHRTLPRYGIQFHPESICSEYGELLLKNFRDGTPRGRRVAFTGEMRQASVAPHGQAGDRTLPGNRVYSRKIPFESANIAHAFETLYGRETHAFWLDSSRAERGMSRFSFMGGLGGPLAAVAMYDRGKGEISVRRPGCRETVRGSIYEFLAEELAFRRCFSDELPFDFNCGFVGYFGYELKAEDGSDEKYRSELPDAAFLFADRLIAFDHEEAAAWLVSYGSPEDARDWMEATARVLANLPAPECVRALPPVDRVVRLTRSRQEYVEAVARCQEYIRDGESYEICLTQQMRSGPLQDALSFYLTLRRINPAPYAAFLRLDGVAVLSCSPERFLRIDRRRVVESRPIKGTRPRGRTPEEDEALRRELADSEKDRAENLMIVDLMRNDLGRVCEPGSVEAPELMKVESYETVHQMVSTVRGRLRPEMDAAQCIRAAFPGGSMTGAPKMRTMDLIDGLETGPRGIYSGALGYLGLCGTADLSVVIRTLVSTPAGTSFGVGGAVVAMSGAEEEFEETLVKARAIIQAFLVSSGGAADAAAVDKVLAELRENG